MGLNTQLTRRHLATLTLTVLVAGCSSWGTTVRLKLTFEVEVDGELKSASNVIEFRMYDVYFPERAGRTAITGEALYLDLGEGRKPLVAILNIHKGLNYGPWGPYGALLAFGIDPSWAPNGTRPGYDRLNRMQGARDLSLEYVPQLVTFKDPLDPKTVELVDPHDLEATLGSDVKWHRVTVEVTDEDITTGVIAKRLPWLKAMDGGSHLDGGRATDLSSLANILQRPDFIKGGF